MLFICFADDNETTTIWPNPAVLPTWAQNFVNTTYSSSGNYYSETVSKYFYQNSYGNLHVIGNVYYITTNYAETYYHQYASSHGDEATRGLIEMEALDKLDNPPYNVDFSTYDNWNRRGDYDIVSTGTDNQVDMIWFMTRNLHDDNLPSGQAKFGTGRAVLDCPTHSRDGKTIKGGGDPAGWPGSGITMFAPHMYAAVNPSGEPLGSGTIVNHVAHEMTHYFFGRGHFADIPYSITANRYGSSLKTYVGGWRSVYSGYEKWRLGWMQPKIIASNQDNCVLYDLGSTITEPSGSTNARLFKIDIPGTSQFFLIENRRWITPFEARYTVDSGSHGLLKPGVLIYHFISDNDNLPSIRVQKIDADGRFSWEMVYHGTNNSSQKDDFIDRDVPDRENG